MAAIGKIRSRGRILITILAIALLGFIAETAIEVLGKTKQADGRTVGIIDGQKVDINEFNQLVEEYRQILKLQGWDELKGDELDRLRDEMWNDFVSKKIIEKEAKELGLTVTDEELKAVLADGTHPALSKVPVINGFVNRQTGRFDHTQVNTYREYLKQAAQQAPSEEQRMQAMEQSRQFEYCWPIVEKLLRQQLLQDKYQVLLEGCISSNPVSAKASFDNTNVESSIVLASLAYSTINDNDVEVSDADIKAKYDENKNAYRTYGETRDVKYVAVQVLPSDADRAKLMEVMNEAYVSFSQDSLPAADVVRAAQSQVAYFPLPVTRAALNRDIASRVDTMHVGEVTEPYENHGDNTFNVVKLISKVQAPDSVEFRSINLMGFDPAAAEKSADSIIQALKAGAVFDSIARNYGQTGEKIWCTSADYQNNPNMIVDTRQYFNTIFSLSQGEVKNLKLTQGNIVLQVTDRRAMVDKYEVAVVKRDINFSTDTHTQAYNQFSQFVSESQNVNGLAEKAAEYGYVVLDRELNPGDHTINGLQRSNEAIRWAFAEAKEGELSKIVQCDNNDGKNDYLLVVGLQKVNPEGYADMGSKKEELKQMVIRDKKFDKLAEKFNGVASIADAEKAGAKIDTINMITFAAPASILGTREPALSGAVSATEKGQFCKTPVKGVQSAYVFEVIDRQAREGVQYDEKKQESMLQQQGLFLIRNLAMRDLMRSVKVEDFRYNFF